MKWVDIIIGLIVSLPLFMVVLYAISAPYWIWLDGKSGTRAGISSDGTWPKW